MTRLSRLSARVTRSSRALGAGRHRGDEAGVRPGAAPAGGALGPWWRCALPVVGSTAVGACDGARAGGLKGFCWSVQGGSWLGREDWVGRWFCWVPSGTVCAPVCASSVVELAFQRQSNERAIYVNVRSRPHEHMGTRKHESFRPDEAPCAVWVATTCGGGTWGSGARHLPGIE